jgi:hypothetical protein
MDTTQVRRATAEIINSALTHLHIDASAMREQIVRCIMHRFDERKASQSKDGVAFIDWIQDQITFELKRLSDEQRRTSAA